MRLHRVEVQNFRGFTERSFDFGPQFNTFIGPNGAGKTALLDAIAVALAAYVRYWVSEKLPLKSADFVRLKGTGFGAEFRLDPQYPVTVEASAEVFGGLVRWHYSRAEGQESDLTSSLKELRDTVVPVRNGSPRLKTTLPVVAYYGVERSLLNDKKAGSWASAEGISNRDILIPRRAYNGCLNPRLSFAGLAQVLLREALFGSTSVEWPAGAAVRQAIIDCIPNARDVFVDPGEFQLLVDIKGQGSLPVANLSSGQRSVLAMVGDLAQRTVRLNPHHGEDALKVVPGVVLIDEIDMHLHPEWQRELPDRLRSVFPKVQFIVTTHSPFVVQAMRPGETISLDGQVPATVDNMGVEAIAAGIMGVEHPQVAPRYREMVENAKRYIATAREAAQDPQGRLEEYKRQLADMLAPYADNPAYQAILEMERIAEVGE